MRTAINRKTGERYAFVAGAWVSLPKEGVEAAAPEAAPEEPGIIDRFVTGPLQRGAGAVVQGVGAAGASTGVLSPETGAKLIVKGSKIAAGAPRDPADEAAMAEISNAKTYKEAAAAALRNPSSWLLTMAESLPQSSLSILGAVFGSVFGPLGLATGAGAGSAAAEYAASLIDAMQELHVDVNDAAQVQKALETPDFMEFAKERAAKRAANVGAFDAASAGVAGKLVAGARGVGSAVGRGTGEVAIQAAAGAAGEAAAQRAVGQDKKGDVLMEAAASLPSGAVEVAAGARHYRKPSVASTAEVDPATPSSPPASGPTAGAGGAPPIPSTPPGTEPLTTSPVGAVPQAAPPVVTPAAATPAPITPVVQTAPVQGTPKPTAAPAPAVTTPPVVAPSAPLAASPKASGVQRKAVASVAKILQPKDAWDPVFEDPDDPRSPVVAYHNEATGETRSPAEHMAPIATPLSGLDPVIKAPEQIAADVADAKALAESKRKQEELAAQAPLVTAPQAATASPAAATDGSVAATAATKKAAEDKRALEVVQATAVANQRPAASVSKPAAKTNAGTVAPSVPEVPTSISPEVMKPAAPTMAEIHAEGAKANPEPTPKQQEAGNYAKGHVTVHGLDFAIETPKGGYRRGTGPDGKPWSVKLGQPYGYVKRTTGADGDHVDSYIVGRQGHAFVVDQIDPKTKQFDEHKILFGTTSRQRATEIYEQGFSDGSGKRRIGAITPMPVDQLKEWLKSGDTTKPVAYKAPAEKAKPAAKGTVNPSPPKAKGDKPPVIQRTNVRTGKVTEFTPTETAAEPAPTAKESFAVDHGEMVPPGGFKTAKGSTYTRDGESTQRTKTLHQGHDPKDVGLKKPSERTVYVDPEAAREAGMHGTLSGRKAIIVRADRAMLVAWNDAANDWGRSPSTKPIPFTTEPEIGKAPIELWQGKGEKRGQLYTNWHAGNPIVELGPTPKPDLEVAPEASPEPASSPPAADEPPAPTEQPPEAVAAPRAAEKPAKPTRVRKVPVSILEFVTGRGGIAMAERSEVNLKRKFVPGFGPIFRKKGVPLDRLREAAAEAGYIRADATVDDLVEALELDDRGDRQFADADQNAAEAIRQEKLTREHRRIEQDARDEVEEYAAANGFELTPEEVNAAAERMLAFKVELPDAVDFVVESAALAEDHATESLGEPLDDIPWEFDELAAEAQPGGQPAPAAAAGVEGAAPEGERAPAQGAEAQGGQSAGNAGASGDARRWYETAQGLRPAKLPFLKGIVTEHIYFSPYRPFGAWQNIAGEIRGDGRDYIQTKGKLSPQQIADLQLVPFSQPAQIDALKDVYSSYPNADPAAYELTNPKTGKSLILTETVKYPDGYQSTHYDETGISGDSQSKTLDEALRDELQAGYTHPVPGQFADVADSLELPPERSPQAVAPKTEKGAEGLPQLVLPGAEATAGQAMAARKGKRLKGKGTQKAADEGIFAPPPDDRQQDIEAAPAAKPAYGSTNALVSVDKAAEIRARLKAKLRSQVSSGVDPEIMTDGVMLAVFHLEAGTRQFVDFARAMLEDLGEAARPYLRSWYEVARWYPGFDSSGMSSAEEIESALRIGIDLERDSGEPAAGDAVGQGDVPATGGRSGQGAGARGSEAGAQPDPVDRGGSLPRGDAALLGADRDQPLEGADGQWHPGLADDREPGRGGSAGEPGPAVDAGAAEAAADLARKPATVTDRAAAQAAADQIEVKVGDEANIRATLPLLQPEQQDDVIKAEARYAKPDGHGFLLTNGTGTGKTYSGLGVIKRLARQGKTNQLILAPSQGILDGWIAAGADLGLQISRLDSTTDAGSGIVATTYANFRDNRHLADRDWDLITADESHNLAQNQAGDETGSLHALRALTYHPDRLHARARMQLRDELDALDARKAAEKSATLDEAIRQMHAKVEALAKSMAAKPRGKVLFLSATPFPYVKTVDYAQGYLFHYQGEASPSGYNQPDPRGSFFMQHFGYRMRTGKLTEPEAGVNSEVMEREFHEWLKREGSLSGRALTVDKDYDRKFVLVDDAIGNRIDQALDFLREAEDGRYRDLYDLVYQQFDYLARMRLLEAIKAQHAIPIIRQHHALGRKVVVFHDYNEGGGLNPFELNIQKDAKSFKTGEMLVDVYADFHAKNPDVRQLKFAELGSPLVQLTKAFPDALVYNGNVTTKLRATARRLFNTDGPGGRNLIIVQSAAGEAGISLHDTTGQHQRVTLNLGMPVRPVTAIQEEGRIYRVGQKSDAVQRYMNTGTNWERWTFAGKIAERAGTAENLAMGENARAMKQAFVEAFSDADAYPASPEDGTGGKEMDRATNLALSPFERAKTFYFAQAKQRGRRDQREGADYFPTPEPLGLKMVEWADIKANDDVLEPSAGHGAIARFFPETSRRTLVEPSSALASRAALASPGAAVVSDRFENLHISRKYDAIVMNPPFGSGGKLAMEHLAKAAKHLRNGGRIVALLPDGGMATKRFEQFMDSEEAKGVYLVADLKMPAVLFERAGTAVRSHVVVLERQNDTAVAGQLQQSNRDYDAEQIGQLFDRIQDATVKPKLEPATKDVRVEETGPGVGSVTINGVELELQGEKIAVIRNKLSKAQFADVARAGRQHGGIYASKSLFFPSAETRRAFLDTLANPTVKAALPADQFTLGETTHAKTGDKLWVASIRDRVDSDTYAALATAAKAQGGWYSSYSQRGAIPGFQFKSEAGRKAFLEAAGGSAPTFTMSDIEGGKAQILSIPGADLDNAQQQAMAAGRYLTANLNDPDWARTRAVIEGELKLLARRLAGPNIMVRAFDMLFSPNGGRVGGTQLRNMITVAMLDGETGLRSGPELLHTVRHEVVHFLKAAGVIAPGAWKMLERQAPKWREAFGIDERYAGLSIEERNEEAIAEAYAFWARGKLKVEPAQVGGLRAIRRFLAAIREMVRRALGWPSMPTPEQIFAAIERGDFVAANPAVADDAATKAHLPGSAAHLLFSPTDIQDNIRQLEGVNYALLQKAMRPGMRGQFGHLVDHARRIFQDRFLRVRRVEEGIEAALGTPLPEEAQPYLQETLYYGRVGEAKFRLDKDFKEPIIKAMHDAGLSLAQVDEYLMARHAEERNEYIASINPRMPDGGSGMKTEDAKAALAKVAALPAAQRQGLQDVAGLVDRMLDARLDVLEQSGLISAGLANTWRTQYESYVPLRGIAGTPDEDVILPKIGQGFKGVTKLEPHAYGRGTGNLAQDILATAFTLADEAIVRAEKNEVQTAVLNLAQMAPDPAVWKVSPVERKAYMASVRDPVTKQWVKQVRYRYMPHTDRADTVIARVAGQPVLVQITDPMLLRAISNIGAAELGPITAHLARFTGLLSKLNTMYSPEFIITNAFMDAQAGLVNLNQEQVAGIKRTVAKNWGRSWKGAYHYLKTGKADTVWSQHAQEFRRAGGATAFMGLVDVAAEAASIEKNLELLGSSKASVGKAALRRFGRFWENANGAVDNAMRLSTFVALREAGYTEAQAARVAKNLTVNFNRKGELGPVANAWFMFFNAAVQGTFVMAKALRSKHVRRFVYAAVAMGIAQELLGGAWEPPEDDEEGLGLSVYDRIPEWEKQTNMIFSYGPNAGDYLKIRMPYGYGFFHSLGRQIAAYLRGAKQPTGEPISLGQTIANMGSSFARNMIPPGLGDTFVPTIAAPFVQILANEDWTGRPIMPTKFPGDDRPDSQLRFPASNPVFNWITEQLNELTGGSAFRPGLVDVSPESVSHVLNTYAGSAGAMAWKFYSIGNRAAAQAMGWSAEDPGWSMNDVPMARRILGSSAPWQAKDFTYQRIAEIEILADEAKADTPAAKRLKSEKRAVLALLPEARRTRKDLGEISKKRRATLANDNMTIAQRRAAVERLASREKALMLRLNDRYMRAVSRPGKPAA